MTEEVILEEQIVYSIFAYREEELQELFAKLAKTAKRLKVEAPTFEIIKRYTRTFRPLDLLWKEPFPVGAIDFTINGVAPKLEGGWEVIAAIDNLGEAGTIVRVNPQYAEEIAVFNDAPPVCEHCNQKRKRNKTVVLQNVDGVRKQVGTTCIKDFVGHNLPALWDIWEELEEFVFEDDFVPRQQASWLPVLPALAVAFRAVEVEGFVKSDGRLPTKERVNDFFHGKDTNGWKAGFIPTEQNLEDANTAYEWITNLDTAGNQFLQNLKVAVLAESTKKHLAFIVALVPTWQKEVNRQVLREEVVSLEVPVTPVVLGRQVLEGIVLSAYTKETDYGNRQVVVFQDARGFKVWGTNPANANVGDRIRFTATVEAGNDESFGFFKRPAKGEIIQLEKAGA